MEKEESNQKTSELKVKDDYNKEFKISFKSPSRTAALVLETDQVPELAYVLMKILRAEGIRGYVEDTDNNKPDEAVIKNINNEENKSGKEA